MPWTVDQIYEIRTLRLTLLQLVVQANSIALDGNASCNLLLQVVHESVVASVLLGDDAGLRNQ